METQTELARAVDVMMMVQAKRIYILIITVNKLFSRRGAFLKETANMYSLFLSSYIETLAKSLGELWEKLRNTGLRLVFPQHFSFSQTSTRVSITR